MKKLIEHTIVFGCLAFCFGTLFAQEALKSMEENYYDMTSLMGITERPYLSYRTLSDNTYNFVESGDAAFADENPGGDSESALPAKVGLKHRNCKTQWRLL